jgi:hypothetical protein
VTSLQASAAIISTNESGDRFWLSDAQAAVLAHEYGPKASPSFLPGFVMAVMNCLSDMDAIKECFKTGRGRNYDAFGKAMACGVCRDLGVWTRHFLVDRVASLPGTG